MSARCELLLLCNQKDCQPVRGVLGVPQRGCKTLVEGERKEEGSVAGNGSSERKRRKVVLPC